MAKIPKFASEQEESDFWDTHDLTEFWDETTPVDIQFRDVRPRKTLISLRLEEETIARLKAVAHGRGIGLQEEITFVEGEKRTVQRPRVFYRREMEANPLVITKP